MFDRYLRMDAGRLILDIDALTRAYPELEDDDQLRADVIEGSTNIDVNSP